MSAILSAFLAHEASIRGVIARFFRNAQDIDDLAQETFLRAFTAERERPILLPKAYLFQTARNVALNELQRRKLSAGPSLEDFPDPDVISMDPQPGPDRQADGRRRLALMLRAIADLPEQCRRVVMLKKLEGRSQSEIAKAMGLSESTVEKHLARGLLLVRERMARLEAGGAPGAPVTPHPSRRRMGEPE